MGDVDSKVETGVPSKTARPVEEEEEEVFEECDTSEEEYMAKSMTCPSPFHATAPRRASRAGWGPRIGPSQLPRRMQANDGGHECELGETIIIFDWDDTLLCTSAINAEAWSHVQLWQLERAVEAVLRVAMILGETVIVTNGIESWVEHSAARYLPGILPLLRTLQVTSARAKHEKDYPGDPFMWKELAFKELLVDSRAKARGSSRSTEKDIRNEEQTSETDSPGSDEEGAGLNLVVLGDGDAEMLAAHTTGQLLSPSPLIKTVKFKAAPSVAELLGQLRRVVQELGQIVEARRNLSHGLVPKVIPDHLGHLSNWASGWMCCSQPGSEDAAEGAVEPDDETICSLGVSKYPLCGLWPAVN